MSSAPPIDLSAIPEEQREAVRAVLRERDALRDANKRLEHLVAELNQVVHGKRSEKMSEDERQLAFEDLEIAVAEVETRQDEQASSPACPRRGRTARRNRGNLPEDLPRIEQVIEPDSLDCPCGCGTMHRIGEDRTERLDIVPAQLRVIVTVRPKYACRSCAEGVTQAPAPAHLIEGGLPTEGAIGHILVSKYANHLPSYRQSQILARSGIDIHRSTLADWIGMAAFHLAPVVDRLAEHLKGSGKLFMKRQRPCWILAGDERRPDTFRRWLAMTAHGAARTRLAWSSPMPLAAPDRMQNRSCRALTAFCSWTATAATNG